VGRLYQKISFKQGGKNENLSSNPGMREIIFQNEFSFG
jgi:hypothetical protein